ncbi:MAG: hypothetical protein HQ546_10580 [Planctomycetes bacterium]|nr:hypothetical protein [Planctomycetota bacterium]
MATTRLILVGGFSGAGKTTLLAQAAARLGQRGLSVGVVTNKQDEDLVDTKLLQGQGLAVREVSGGCFCCRFGCLLTASDLLSEDSDKDVLLAEPVGSCTDIYSTVVQPLKEFYASRFSVAPYSVLADPTGLRQVLGVSGRNPLPKKVSDIYRNQLEEADLIILNKVDLLSGDQIVELKALVSEAFPDTPVLEMSALTGNGIDSWLAWLAGDQTDVGRIADVG